MSGHCINLNGFSEVARDHAMQPRNFGPLDGSDGYRKITGPCGDTMAFWLVVNQGVVQQASFITDGCGSSLACGSMATSLAMGKRVEEAAAISQKDILDALGGLPTELEHCALLASNTLKAACENCLARQSRPRAYSACDTCQNTECSAATRQPEESQEEFDERRKLQSRMCRIRRKIVVLSGKGGVGKSTVAVNIATALMLAGHRVGLLDTDIHGPSIPTMLGLTNIDMNHTDEGILPFELGELKVVSLGFFLPNADDAVIWRGPRKMSVIRQFLQDVVWDELDYLIVDSPPGTGDEPLAVCQLIGDVDGAIIVTTPQKVAAVDVRKSVTFCQQLGVPILGVVENMSGFVCPECGNITHILPAGGGKRIAEDFGFPLLGSIPLDPHVAQACDAGRVFVHHYADSLTAQLMRNIVKPIAALDQ